MSDKNIDVCGLFDQTIENRECDDNHVIGNHSVDMIKIYEMELSSKFHVFVGLMSELL